MKFSFIFATIITGLFFSHSTGIAQDVKKKTITRSILDFGALPNDGKDDTWAFIKAGKYFSNLWDKDGIPLTGSKTNFSYASNIAKLEIPSGTYHVGKQISVPENGLSTTYGAIFGFPKANAPIEVSGKGAFKVGLEVMLLSNPANNIDGISIIGTGPTKPVIKFNDNLSYGYYDSKGKALNLTDETYITGRWALTVGSFLYTDHVKNLRIENIEIDGNNRSKELGGKTNYGGSYAIHGIQMGAAGAYLLNTKNITVKNVAFNYMTLDGIILQDYYYDPSKFPKQELTNFKMDSCTFNYNRRQGFSWVGGRNISVSNSSFSFTGRSVDGAALGNPGAGIDIEPEQDAKGEMLWCIDGKFSNIKAIDNYGCALLNDVTAYRSRELVFTNSIFHDVQGYSVWVKGAAVKFENCKIWGGFIYGNEAKVDADATRFIKCDFADEEVPGKKGVHNNGFALVESWHITRKLYFTDCTFRTLHPGQRLMALYSTGTKEADFINFSNCRFIIGEKSFAGDNVLFGVSFDGNTKLQSLNKEQNSTIAINGIVFKGSENASLPNSFTTQGRIMLFPANSNGKSLRQFIIGSLGAGKSNDGYIHFKIGEGACLYTFWGQIIDIGKNAAFVNQAGGQLGMLSAIVNNNGKIVLEEGSFSAFFHPVEVKTSFQGSFHASQAAKMGIYPAWKKELSSIGSGLGWQSLLLSSKLKVTGGNKNIPAVKSLK